MRSFMDDRCFIGNDEGYRLYQGCRALPIYDYHCHLSPQEIYEDVRPPELGELWLKNDHYKWRLLRMNGAPERLVTGDAPYEEKFLAFAAALERAPGSPVAHFAQLELRNLFGIREPLNRATAPDIYRRANARIAQGGFSARELIQRANVELIGTTDDPADGLEWHERLRGQLAARVVPCFRPDKAFALNQPGYGAYIARLSQRVGLPIRTLPDLCAALENRLTAFQELGSRIADHGVNEFPRHDLDEAAADRAFRAALAGESVPAREAEGFLWYMLAWCAAQYARRGMAMQLHTAVLRNVNSRIFRDAGPDSGIDSIGAMPDIAALGRFLDRVEREGGLPRMVFYSLNPAAQMALATMAGNFGAEGRMQLGSAWWFNDHRDGIQEQLRIVANTGLLGRFVGMLTDSRSFLSYARHDYFRRVLCSLLGEWVEAGELAGDVDALAHAICIDNAREFFGM